jgi:lipoprotein-releasing system ATP-binding protein
MQLHEQERNVLVVVTHSSELAKLFPQRFEMNDGALQPA